MLDYYINVDRMHTLGSQSIYRKTRRVEQTALGTYLHNEGSATTLTKRTTVTGTNALQLRSIVTTTRITELVSDTIHLTDMWIRGRPSDENVHSCALLKGQESLSVGPCIRMTRASCPCCGIVTRASTWSRTGGLLKIFSVCFVVGEHVSEGPLF